MKLMKRFLLPLLLLAATLLPHPSRAQIAQAPQINSVYMSGGVQLPDKSFASVYASVNQMVLANGQKSTRGLVAVTGMNARFNGAVVDADFTSTHATLTVSNGNPVNP